MNTIVEVEGLGKTYGETVAVDKISFDVFEGEIFGMVGPNGAGKTTTIECLEGLRVPDQGSIRVLGVDPARESHVLRKHTGIQLQESNLPDRMKVWEALDLYTSFYPKVIDWEHLLVQLGLDEKRNAPFRKLSGGQKQRLFIALALLPDPKLVFLDELTTGLDPRARHAIWDLVQGVRGRGKTVILTTHFMEEAERLCDRVAILDQGKIVALDTPSSLISNMGVEERVVFSLDGFMPPGLFEDLSGDIKVEVNGEQVVVRSRNGRNDPLVSDVVKQLSVNNISFRDLRTEQPNLEDVFLNLTGRTLDEVELE
jgi:ABC-2 type transport system ATP-binding protein